MQLHTPDPQFTQPKKDKKNFLLAFKIAWYFLTLLWIILIVDQYFGLQLSRFGLRPLDLSGLLGILTAPLLHGDVEHLVSNSLPLIVSLTTVLYLYPNVSLRTLPMIWLGSGLLGWLIGRPNIHIGVSGFIYGMLAFIFVSGVIRRDRRSIAVALLVGFLYGSMVWGVLPINSKMSWELHLSGAVLGVVMAFWYRNWDRVPIKHYDWEDDDSIPDWYPDPERDAERERIAAQERDASEDDDKPRPPTIH
ncbi:MAG: rhomboid family intramembrane serine protease [Gallionella sp.]